MSKIYFIEGLPGTGKSTISEWLADELKQNGSECVLLLEENPLCPTSFLNIACLTNKEYESFLYKETFKNSTIQSCEHYYIDFTNAPPETLEIINAFYIGNEFNSHFDAQSYIEKALPYIKFRFEKLCENNCNYVMDSVLLQNPVNEVIFRKGTPEQVIDFISLITEVIQSDFTCIYIDRNDVAKSMEFAQKVKGEGWTTGVNELLNQCGFSNFFEDRYNVEKEILERSNFSTLVCDLVNSDWTTVKNRISYEMRNSL